MCLALTSAAVVSAQPPSTPRLGAIVFPATGKPEPHRAFLEGVSWLHSFGYEQALDAFRAALKLDPGFVMASWGEAMTHNHPVWHTQDLEAGRRALSRLGATREARAARAATARERAYLAAVELLFGDGDKTSRDLAYAGAMQQLAARYPDDQEAASFYALSLLGAVPLGERGTRSQLEAGEIAERILQRNPNHPGAAHIVIHAYDDPENARRALPAARTYARIAPDSSHALHMPAHIFIQLGMWDEAVASDEAAFAASTAWVDRKRFSLAMRDFHSLSWLSYELLQQGRFAKAQSTFAPLEEAIAQASSTPAKAMRPSMPHHQPDAVGQPDVMSLKNDLASIRAYFVIESRRWTEMKGKSSFDNLDELFALGLGAARLGDLDRAKAAWELLRKFVATDTDEGRKPLAIVMEKELEAAVALAEKRGDAALAALGQAIEVEGRMRRPSARPRPIKPTNEMLGETLLELGRPPSEAVKAFERALWWAPNRSLAVLGLARALAKSGDRASARKQYEQFRKNWARADPGLKEVQEAKAYLGGSPSVDR
jgi:tetratricopeptide (TPR) repeat protein